MHTDNFTTTNCNSHIFIGGLVFKYNCEKMQHAIKKAGYKWKHCLFYVLENKRGSLLYFLKYSNEFWNAFQVDVEW